MYGIEFSQMVSLIFIELLKMQLMNLNDLNIYAGEKRRNCEKNLFYENHKKDKIKKWFKRKSLNQLRFLLLSTLTKS